MEEKVEETFPSVKRAARIKAPKVKFEAEIYAGYQPALKVAPQSKLVLHELHNMREGDTVNVWSMVKTAGQLTV
eukprot:1150583-Pelagomonas_calceolata.AAC.1